MSETQLTPQQILKTGITPTLSAANADGSYFHNDGRTYIDVACAGVETTLTIDTPGVKDGDLDIEDRDVVIPATTGHKKIGPLAPSIYNDADGNAHITFTQVTGLTIGIFRL